MSHTMSAQNIPTSLIDSLVDVLIDAETCCDTHTCKGCPNDGDMICRVRAMADYLLRNKPAALHYVPCKIGDTVWGIQRRGRTLCPMKGKVSEISFVGPEMAVCIVVDKVGRGPWGINVFPTKDEAEEAIQRILKDKQ